MRRADNNKEFNYDYNERNHRKKRPKKVNKTLRNTRGSSTSKRRPDYNRDNYDYKNNNLNYDEYSNGYSNGYNEDYTAYTDYNNYNNYDDYSDYDNNYDDYNDYDSEYYNDGYYNDCDEYNYDYENYDYQPQDRKKRSVGRWIKRIFLILIVAFCAWLLYSLASSLVTGNKFSVFGPATRDTRDIVVAGVDEGGYRTDLILLCHIDRVNNQMNILQIPRDTKIDNKRNDKKINSAYYSGFDCMSREISQVTGIAPDGYIMVSFEGFNEIIDSIGGVTVDVPVRMNYTDPAQDLTIDLQPGKQHLDGEHAQMFMRFRKNNDGTGYANGDMDRINTQKLLYDAVIKKVKNPMIVMRVPSILSAFKKYTTTNLEDDFTGVLRDMAACAGDVNFYSVPGSGKYIGGVSYFVADKAETKKIVNEHFVSSNNNE